MQDFEMAVLLSELNELSPEVTSVLATLMCKISVGEWTNLVSKVATDAVSLSAEQREWLAELLLALDSPPA